MYLREKSPLHYAAKHNNVEAERCLMQNAADANIRDTDDHIADEKASIQEQSANYIIVEDNNGVTKNNNKLDLTSYDSKDLIDTDSELGGGINYYHW